MSFDKNILKQVPGCVGWKRLDLTYAGANDNLLHQFGLKYQEELIGHSDASLSKNKPHENDMFYEQDLLALRGKTQRVIHFLESDGDSSVCFLSKSPLTTNGEVSGVIYHCQDWPQPEIMQLLRVVDQKFGTNKPDDLQYYSLDENHNFKGLSKRELECLFLILRSKSAKQIAYILGLSRRTVESYIDSIKLKFGVSNKSELIISAMMINYHRYIPKRFLGKDLLAVLND